MQYSYNTFSELWKYNDPPTNAAYYKTIHYILISTVGAPTYPCGLLKCLSVGLICQKFKKKVTNLMFRQNMSQTLTFVLQAAFSVSFDLHLAQVLGALVLQQSSLSLQLPQRCLDFLPAAHLIREEITSNVRGRTSLSQRGSNGTNPFSPPCLIL